MHTTKNITTSIKDLFADSDPLKLDGTSFMFGLSLSSGVGFEGVDDTYLTTSMTFVRNLDGNYFFYFKNFNLIISILKKFTNLIYMTLCKYFILTNKIYLISLSKIIKIQC